MMTVPTATFKSHYKNLGALESHNPQKSTTLHQPRPTPPETPSLRLRRRLSRRRMMAKNTKKLANGSNWQYWTNERHVHFLNSMEASFVQSMFENNVRFAPLDRYLPDSSESTEELGKDRRRRNSASDNVESSERRTEKPTRTLSCQKSSQDQVVPQFQNKRDDNDKDRLDISFGTAH